MPRLMSCGHTEAAVVARTKTVTRRLGWLFLKPGDHVTLCRKVMGRRKGEPLVRLAEVEIVSVRREPLWKMRDSEVGREGVSLDVFIDGHDRDCAACRPIAWTEWFARTMRCTVYDDVTRIEWRYLSPRLSDPEGPVGL